MNQAKRIKNTKSTPKRNLHGKTNIVCNIALQNRWALFTVLPRIVIIFDWSHCTKRNTRNEGWQRNQIEKTAAQCVEYIKRLTAKNNIFNILSWFFLFSFSVFHVENEAGAKHIQNSFGNLCIFRILVYSMLGASMLFCMHSRLFCSVGFFLARFGAIEKCLFWHAYKIEWDIPHSVHVKDSPPQLSRFLLLRL